MIFYKDKKEELPPHFSIPQIFDQKNIEISNSKLISGFPFKGSDFLDKGKYKIFKIKNINDFDFKYTNSKNNKVLLKEFDVITGLSGTIGTSTIILENNVYLLNQRLLSIRSQYPLVIKKIIEKNKRKLINNSTGSVQRNITTNDVAKISYDIRLENILNKNLSYYYVLASKIIILCKKIIDAIGLLLIK